MFGVMEPVNACVCVGTFGGRVVPLLNMGARIGTNRANANPAYSAGCACTNCASRVARANELSQSPCGTAAPAPDYFAFAGSPEGHSSPTIAPTARLAASGVRRSPNAARALSHQTMRPSRRSSAQAIPVWAAR